MKTIFTVFAGNTGSLTNYVQDEKLSQVIHPESGVETSNVP